MLRCQLSSWRYTKVSLGRFTPDLSIENTDGKIPTEGFVGSAVIADYVCTRKLFIQESDELCKTKLMH